LNAAAGNSPAEYDGLGRFWDQGLDFLKSARLHGIAMIAAEKPRSCCGHQAKADRYRRGAASGLIQGLKGEAPFDGSRFPPLPWRGQRVAEADIQFIADWIDADCPEDDYIAPTTESFPLRLEAEAAPPIVVRDNSEFCLAPAGVWRPARPGELKQRVNLDCLNEAELDQLRAAFRHLYYLNQWPEDRRSFNNQALIHQNHCQHGWERFLTWHRAYLYEFEQNIQDFHPNLTLPYWDWTMAQYRPEQPEKGWIIPKSLQAFLTVEAVAALLPKLNPKATSAQEAKFLAWAEQRRYFASQSAFFRHVYNDIGYTDLTPKPDDKNRQAMIDALLDSNALWYPLRYPAEYKDGGTINQVIHYHYPSARDIHEIMSLNNFRDFGGGSIYDAAFGFLDQNPHNTLHIWTGGENPYKDGKGSYAANAAAAAPAPTAASRLAERRNSVVRAGGRRFHSRSDMYQQPQFGDMFSNLTASYDPVFWPIHVNVDRLWWEWQKHNPHSGPEELDAILSPWNYTQRDTLNAARFGYEYVRNTCFIPVGLDAPVGRFLSRPIPVSELTQGFRKAEVRLHWIPQLERSCFIRVFLNQPGADAHTDWRGNPHFAGYLAIFGHGACYGGPGHCAAPPPKPREYDLRAPNHNMPRNHRIDVTECARRLLETADALQIALVVIGGDYEEEIDLLKLEGVSLNFLD
jgi:tyrosinase